MKRLTKEQFLEMYGEVKVTFAYYYKYSFLFVGESEGKKLNIYVGGNADDIYRFDVEPNKEYQIKEFNINYATVVEDGVTIAESTSYWN